MFDPAEAATRWARVRRVLDDANLDGLLAIDWSRDEILSGTQRWLTGYIPAGGPAAVLMMRSGNIELISERIGQPVAEYYAAHDFAIALVNEAPAAALSVRLARHGIQRLGVAEAAALPWSLAANLLRGAPGLELVDASAATARLRFRKSAYEVGLVRKSCEIADTVWKQVPGLLKAGRANRDVVADIDHLVRREGAEGGFHLLLKMPFRGRPMLSIANPEVIEMGARYLVEISPRYEGYYAQLTIPVAVGPADPAMQSAAADLQEVKRQAQPLMRPGADLSEIAGSIQRSLAAYGHAMTSLSLGHFCGMTLEEPRHEPTAPFLLEEGMTFIFHPVLAEEPFFSLMRADTYLITASGAERLTHYAE